MTDRSFAPAAIAKVAPSWVLIPQSAAPDETRISGARARVRDDPEVDRLVGVGPVLLGDVEPDVVRVRGPVEGELDRRGRRSGAGRRARRRRSRRWGRRPARRRTGRSGGWARPTGRAGPDDDRPDGEGDAEWWTLHAGPDLPTRTKPPLPWSGNGVESGRPASYTGMSRIRFGGSVALATLSARSRSPEAYSVVSRVYSGSPSTAPNTSAAFRPPNPNEVDRTRR